MLEVLTEMSELTQEQMEYLINKHWDKVKDHLPMVLDPKLTREQLIELAYTVLKHTLDKE